MVQPQKLAGITDSFPAISLQVTKHDGDGSDNLPSPQILQLNGARLSGGRVTGVPCVADFAAGCSHHRRTLNGTWSL